MNLHETMLRPRRLLMLAVLALAGLPQLASAAPACGPEIKEEIAKQLASAAKLPIADQLKLQAQIFDQYQSCAKDDTPTPSGFIAAARNCGAAVAYAGSLYYEEMSCCGYDPQRRSFACPVKVKQNVGFGPAPNPGSREYVLHCVADTAGVMHPVGDDSVHLANSRFAPSWQFAVVANAVDNLGLIQPNDGSVRRARSILSWNLKPTDCNYKPIWGNWLDYRIRLDQ